MEPQKQNQFTKVTPLSKTLAAMLFIVLPFVGLYIGYTFAPEKVVEVERIIVKEVEKEIKYPGTLYRNDYYDFQFHLPPDWIVGEENFEVSQIIFNLRVESDNALIVSVLDETVDSVVGRLLFHLEDAVESETVINGISVRTAEGVDPFGVAFKNFYFEESVDPIEFSFVIREEDSENEIESILNSFQIIR